MNQGCFLPLPLLTKSVYRLMIKDSGVGKNQLRSRRKKMEERKIKGVGFTTGVWPLDPAKSTIVFIHGAGGSSMFWQAQVDGLSRRANTIAVDLPGHGASEGGGRNTIEDYARSVIDFMKLIEAPNPIPCGLSMGGAITLQLLLDFPDQLMAGILINTGAKLKVAPVIFETIENDYNGYLAMIGEFVASKTANPEKLRRFQEEAASCRPEIALGDFQACNRFDVIKRLGSITVPVLIVSADEDQLTPPKYGEFLQNNIPQACRIHVMAAGHIVPLEKPDEFNRAVIEFLDGANL